MDARDSESEKQFEALTSREFEILTLLAEGLSDREIADRLTVAYSTVKWYNRQIFNKLGVENRREAVERAKNLNLLQNGKTSHDAKSSLPAHTTPFVGRDRELKDLARLLLSKQARLITILAPGGMGKTRLALAAAEAVFAHFPNGVFFVSLAPLSVADQMVSAIAESAGFQFAPDSRTPKQQLLDFFREKSLLLILDNFEHLLDGASLVTDILQAARGVVVIATSRERLNLSSEMIFTLGGMSYPEAIGSVDQQTYGALQLFEQCARRMRPEFSLAEDSESVARVCQLVQGMPLAIELAAAWVNTLSLAEIAEEIRHNLDFLQTTMGDMPERLRSIRAVFESTWKRLDEREQTVFRRLSVFRGGCTREAARVVADAEIKTLMEFVDKALLWHVPDTGRYEVHELLRQYGEEQLEQSGEGEATRDAHSVYFMSLLHQRQTDLEGRNQVEVLKEIEHEVENVRSAWLWAAQHQLDEQIRQSLQSLWLVYLIRGQYADGIALFEQAAAALRYAPPSPERDTLLGALLAHEAFLRAGLTQNGRAERLLEESQSLLQNSDELGEQAFLALAQGEMHKISDLERALRLYRGAGNRWGQALALRGLGECLLGAPSGRQALDLPRAREALQEALTIQESLRDSFFRARTLSILGFAACMARDYEKMDLFTRASFEHSKRLGNLTAVASGLNNLSISASRLGRFAEAERYMQESLLVRRRAGNVWGIIWQLCNLGNNANAEGNFERFRQYADEALALAEGREIAEWIIQALEYTVWSRWQQGEYRDARNLAERHVKLAEAVNDADVVGTSLISLALVTLAEEEWAEAHRILNRVMSLIPEAEFSAHREACRNQLGRVAYEEGDYGSARRLLEMGLANIKTATAQYIVDEFWEHTEVAEARVTLGDVERAEGHFEAARHNLYEALKEAMTIHHVPETLKALGGFADLLAAETQPAQAAELAALIHNHRGAFAVDRTRTGRLLDKLQIEMPPDVYAAALERGKALELEAVVAELLAE